VRDSGERLADKKISDQRYNSASARYRIEAVEAGCRLLSRLCSDDGGVVALKDAGTATVVLALEAHSSNTNVTEPALLGIVEDVSSDFVARAPLVKGHGRYEVSDNDQVSCRFLALLRIPARHIPATDGC
jgi:hypothetical protein